MQTPVAIVTTAVIKVVREAELNRRGMKLLGKRKK